MRKMISRCVRRCLLLLEEIQPFRLPLEKAT
jgi:hypothetical protein